MVNLSPAFAELHFTPQQLSALWGFSEKVIRSMFRDEAGVLQLDSHGGRIRRGKLTLRIPASVAQRVYEQRCNRGLSQEIKRVRRSVE